VGNAEALRVARGKDSALRRERVLAAVTQLHQAGEQPTISSVARVAGVHRSFLHRHPDLTAALRAAPPVAAPSGHATTASDISLRTELANAHAANRRLAAYTRRLEHRLSETLGHEAVRVTGLSDRAADTDTSALLARIHELEQHIADLRVELAERDEDLQAARAANRQLIAAGNRRT
jgi:hypothetical protein